MADIPPDMTPTGPRSAAARLTDADNPASPVTGASAARVEAELLQAIALSYRPSLPIYSARNADGNNFDFWADCDAMRNDAAIRLPLEWVMGPIAHAEWGIEARSQAEAQFMAKQIQWFWSNAVGRTQEEGYVWGWCSAEMTYGIQDGLMVQERFDTFAARDADPLLRDGIPVGIRINNTDSHSRDLWAWREDVPNKGFWYAHRARHGLRRGRSQIRPAWRPWRRLMGRDGAEEIVDLGYYRHGIGQTVVDHPNIVQTAAAGEAPPFAVNGKWHTRDEARMIAEQAKGGAGIAIPSKADQNGNRLWDYRILDAGVNGSQLIEYVEYLERLCSKAIGVPPELFQAAQTGSGYSGRAIPLQAFLVAQQRPLDDLTREWLLQIGLPLLRWNFGPDAWARITPVPLIESYRKSAWDGPSGGGQGGPPSPGGFAPGQAQPQGPPPGGDDGMAPDGQPLAATMATEVCLDDLDSLADQLAGMSVAELEALAKAAGVGNHDHRDFGETI